MQPSMSQFHIYSIGIASQNKPLDSDELFVVPIEITPFADGELDARAETFEASGQDRLNKSYTVKVEQNNSIEATWFRLGHSNQRTSPDVRRGERVMLYRHSDSGQFFWASMGMDDHLRRLETVIYSWSDTQDESKNATDPENSYSLEICTHTKQVTFRTVKADQEPFAYTFQFNTKDGVVVLTDDVGNYFQMDSAQTKLTVMNADGSYTHWDRENINHYAPNDITMLADNDISIEAGANYNLTVGQNYTSKVGQNVTATVGGNQTLDVKGTHSENAGSGHTLKCGGSTIQITPGSISINAPSVSIN